MFSKNFIKQIKKKTINKTNEKNDIYFLIDYFTIIKWIHNQTSSISCGFV